MIMDSNELELSQCEINLEDGKITFTFVLDEWRDGVVCDLLCKKCLVFVLKFASNLMHTKQIAKCFLCNLVNAFGKTL